MRVINIFRKIKEILKTKKIWLVLLLLLLIFVGWNKIVIAADIIPNDTPKLPNPMLYGNPIGALISGIGVFFSSVLLKLPTLIAIIIAQVGGFIINMEGKLLSWVIDVGSFTKLGVVQEGWRICRDFANLFFIAILIYIAFATILRLQKVDAKKMLFKIITMAIIINFSLMIGGIIIDFSQVLFKYFIFAPLEGQDKDGFHFSEILMNAVGVQKMLVTSAALDAGSVLVRLVFVIIFTFLCVIVFGALVLTLFVRNFWLWILLILAPLAWFLSIVPIPMLSKYSGEWWRNFLKWCFMAPIMGFFIFLSVGILGSNQKAADQLTKSLTKIEKQYTLDGKNRDTSVISFNERPDSIFHPKTLIKFLITLAFLIGGLMAGQSLGSGAAKGVLGMMDKTRKNAQKQMKQWTGRKAMQTAPVRGVGNVLMKMGNIPLVGGVFKRAGMATQGGVAGARGEDLKKAQNRTKYMSDNQLNKYWDTFNKFEKQAAAKRLGNDKLDAKQFEDMQKIYSSKGMNKELKDLQKEAPHFTSDFKREAEKLVEKKQEFFKVSTNYNTASGAVVEAEKEHRVQDDSYKSADAIYKVVEEKVKKAEVEINSLDKAGAPQSTVVEARNKLVGGVKKELNEANKNRNEAGSKLQFASSRLEELEKKRNDAKNAKEKIENELNKVGAPILERLKDVDISKLNSLSKMMEGEQRNSPQSQAILYAVERGSPAGIVKFVSSNQVKEADGKKDIDGTMNLRKEIGNKIMEDLYSSGGIDAVLKMTKINSSPSAMAGGYGFNSLVDGMNMIDANIKADIKSRAYKQKKTDEFISKIAEEVSERGVKDTMKKNKDNTEEKTEKTSGWSNKEKV